MRPKQATPNRKAGRREFVRALSTRSAVGAIAGLVVLVVTGWPVMAVGAVLLAIGWKGLSGGAASERTAMRQLEGLAAWTESLRDTIAGAAGLEQAIPSSIRAAAPTLRPHLLALVDRLRTRMALPDALRLFADELDDPSADLVVAALILNSSCAAPVCATCSARWPYRPARSSTCAAGSRRSVAPPGAAPRSWSVRPSPSPPCWSCSTPPTSRSTTTPSARPYSWSSPGSSAPGSPGCAGWPVSTSPPACWACPPEVRCAMTEELLAGAVLGLGLFLLIRALFPARPGLVTRLLALDAAREGTNASAARLILPDEEVSAFRRNLGVRLARFYAARGWEVRSAKADLALLGKSFEGFLATKVLLAVSGLLAFPLLLGWLVLMEWGVSLTIPLWAALIVAGLFFVLPDLQIKRDAARMRRDFRHVVGSFLDLVAMNLAGGRGVPEALMMAVSVGSPGPDDEGTNWAMSRIREALGNARIVGITPGRPSASSVTRSTSTSCATCPPHSGWSPTTVPRSARP
ncbi:hypothetical protein ACFQX6_33550 [Streptosporangium lutulentum]